MLCFICTDLTYSQTLCHVRATGSVKFSLGAHALFKRTDLDVNNSRPHEQVPCAHEAAAAYEIMHLHSKVSAGATWPNGRLLFTLFALFAPFVIHTDMCSVATFKLRPDVGY